MQIWGQSISDFSIHPNSVDVDKQKLVDISKRLKTFYKNIDQSRFEIRKNQGLMKDDSLSIISENVLKEALVADSLYEALDKILSCYINTDQTLAAEGHKQKQVNPSGNQRAGIMMSPSMGVPLVNLVILRMFWNWLKKYFGFDGDGNTSPHEVTREEEKKNDQYLQSEVFEILKEDEFSKKAWKKADVEGRKDILRKFIKRLENTMA